MSLRQLLQDSQSGRTRPALRASCSPSRLRKCGDSAGVRRTGTCPRRILLLNPLDGVTTPMAARDIESLPAAYILKDNSPLIHSVAVWLGAAFSRGLGT